MPSPRLILATGFVLVTITTLWFGFSATKLSQNPIISSSQKDCPAVIQVAESTCHVTYTATLFQTSTILATAQAQALPSTPPTEASKQPSEDAEGSPTEDKDAVKSNIPSKPSQDPASLTTPAPKPLLSPSDDENFNLTEVLTKYNCYPASADEVRKAAFDSVPSVKFNVVRGDNVVLGRRSKSAGQPFKKWFSVGRKPSTGCWTYDDRLGKYSSPVPRFSRTLGVINDCNPEWKRALVVHMAKGQSWNQHFLHHLTAIIAEAGWVAEFHIYLLVHVDGDKAAQKDYVDHAIPEGLRPLAITFNSDDLKTYLGKDVPFDKYENNMHVAVQRFMRDYSKYEFVYFINPHTRLMGRWDTLLKSVDEEYAFHRELTEEGKDMPERPDLVTFDVTREPDEKWDVLEPKCLEFFKGGENEKAKVRRSLSALGGYSRRMVEALAAVNMQKINCHSEYFAPTVAAHKNLTTFFYQHPLYTTEEAAASNATTAKVATNDAITVQQEKVAFDLSYSGDAKDAEAFWAEWVENKDICRPEALLHPISGQL
ncbi:hypothetical protein TWF569_009642 [Orbilia oligospora]|uniref:Uncharacterized protein n=1 Tax=Orbilia oligospora TaxID=2813651 RepID=A0A7C8NEC9_ORBOL|nr:hypothetical protein TWF706_011823 [Orbilia oligospora]KAF3111932.1 hypothetical protein TWF102_005693 [Orbilia oligospora]KAF3114618.1 hypothetical protein TWF103_001078 [Orbilia oligospora]KAF3135704.1 hypothetical protein TWF569_009642 [Orbilia oligospora]KAF3146477.1 hypothetical protein TWF594_003270 [Orbilia oligospora]